MRRRFFVEQFGDGTAQLQGDAAHHLARVLRAEPGQLYELSDGRDVYLAKVTDVARDSVDFSLEQQLAARETSLYATLLLAIVKFDRFEWALEKATELGVSVVIPIAAQRSEKGLVAAAVKRAERWRKLLSESAQQARRLRPPVLQPLAHAGDAFRGSTDQLKIVLSERGAARPLRDVLREPQSVRDGEGVSRSQVNGGDGGVDSGAASESAAHSPSASADQADASVRISFAVGPEGGWTDGEFAAAHSAGFVEASIGKNILRTETAVIAGLAVLYFQFDDSGM